MRGYRVQNTFRILKYLSILKANDPNTEWVDGEEFMTRFEAEIDEAEKAESAR